ncbi:Zinc finger CCCH domain-containing protein 6 [Abeliophyllum distichum]|uniref:Zinc finger CCCH domain-containing protein 6 n=1 Tax=Abeliophyllum distichum TaxID=126358 RepID=A0ABD1TJN1_9LAMI
MGGSQKSKRITWASDVNLCQVRLFLSDESPSQVGLGSQDHLQAKTLWAVHSAGTVSDDNLPPGFEGIQTSNLWRTKLSQIPLIKWRCPPRFVVRGAWQVVAGEESKEMEAQNQREMRVLEAIYPRPSSIPPNPSAPVGADISFPNDQNTPRIPITPIEDEDAALDASSVDSMVPNPVPIISQPQLLALGTSSSQGNATTNPHPRFSATIIEPDVVAAAQAALTAVMSSSDQKDFIDHNLLIKLLGDPKMIEQLVTNHGAASSMQNLPPSGLQNTQAVGLQNISSSSTLSMPPISLHNMPSTGPPNMLDLRSPTKSVCDPLPVVNKGDSPSGYNTRPELSPSTASPSRPFYHHSSMMGPIPSLRSSVADVSSAAPSPSLGTPITKDINYYKSLIQQHGGERQENLPHFGSQTIQEPINTTKSRDSKSKIMKPCMFFNSPRGCRNGVNCTFLHDASSQQRVNNIPEIQSAKRMKMDREITGSQYLSMIDGLSIKILLKIFPLLPESCSSITTPATIATTADQPIMLLTVNQFCSIRPTHHTAHRHTGAVETENTHGDGENDEALDDEIDRVGGVGDRHLPMTLDNDPTRGACKHFKTSRIVCTTPEKFEFYTTQ